MTDVEPRLVDLYSGAGIGADGYFKAGFELTCIDIEPQPDCPYRSFQADALDELQGDAPAFFDAIDASPPCQAHTRAKHLRAAQNGRSRYADLLTKTLRLLRTRWDHKAWVVENVPGTEQIMEPLAGESLITLCGSMFDLGVQRHRLFLSNVPLVAPGPCQHWTFERDPITGKPRPWGVYHVPGDSIPNGGRTARDLAHAKEVMGVRADRRVTWAALKEAIPPAYTRWVGAYMLDRVKARAA